MNTNEFLVAMARHDGVALCTPDGAVGTLELLDRVEAYGRALGGARVLAVLADNGADAVAADLAAMARGVVHLALPGFFSDGQLRHVLQAAGVDVVWTDQPQRIDALGLGFNAAGSAGSLQRMQRSCSPVALPAGTGKISFTSGSSGTPRGVCLRIDGLLDRAAAVRDALESVDIQRHLVVLPLALLLENVAGVYAPLLRGASVALHSLGELGWRGMAGFDPSALQACALRSRANSAILVPELLKAWSVALSASRARAPVALRYLAVGGAAVSSRLLCRARAQGLPAYQGYGLTECGSVVSMNLPGHDGAGVGRVLGGLRVEEDAGELVVHGSPFLGYLDGEGAPEGCGLHTGDLGSVGVDGQLQLRGRRGNMLITSYGRNISPEWVESELLAQRDIAQAVVFGDAMPALGALLVPARGADALALERALARANSQLPDYARVQRWMLADPFTVQAGEATGNGRPVRGRIHARYASQMAAIHVDEEI